MPVREGPKNGNKEKRMANFSPEGLTEEAISELDLKGE